MELGQPMHVFDADTIEGHMIVRQAKSGETLIALDGKEYTLTPEDIVIADTKKILSIAGVMGGLHTGVSEKTRNICFEAAVFDATSIRLTAQRLGLRSDASTRYEKSLDPLGAERALVRAVQILRFLGHTAPVSAGSRYLDPTQVRQTTLRVSHEFLTSRLGKSLDSKEIEVTLENLGFSPKVENEEYVLQVPSWRATKDVTI